MKEQGDAIVVSTFVASLDCPELYAVFAISAYESPGFL